MGGTDKAAFQISRLPRLPASRGGRQLGGHRPGLDGDGLRTGGAGQNSGAALAIATLTATAGAVTAQANLYDLVLTSPTHEPTLGEILTTLGCSRSTLASHRATIHLSQRRDELPKGIEAGTPTRS